MISLVLTLDPRELKNPDLDLRYVVPDMLTAQSHANINDNGFDYEDREGDSAPLMAIFLTANDLNSARSTITNFVLHERVLENDLSQAAMLYLEEEGNRSEIPFV